MAHRQDELASVLAEVRRRWTRRARLSAWAVGTLAAAMLLGVGGLTVWLLASEGLPLAFVVVIVLAAVAVALVAAGRPVAQPPSDLQLARFIAEQAGGLDDVVVTAVLIPGIGGIEGTAQIKTDWPHVQVVAMSEGVDEKITAVHVLAAAKAAGADGLLPKPFHMPDMLKTVAGVLRAKDAPVEEVTSAAQDAIDAIFAR